MYQDILQVGLLLLVVKNYDNMYKRKKDIVDKNIQHHHSDRCLFVAQDVLVFHHISLTDSKEQIVLFNAPCSDASLNSIFLNILARCEYSV